MRIPPLKSPERYVGLFVFDFGDHTSVGYTVEEIAILRRQPKYANGVAYSVQAADESGRMELCGLSAERLCTEEGLIHGYKETDAARLSYDCLQDLAEDHPLPARVRLELAEYHAHRAPHVVVLMYPAYAAGLIGDWLRRSGFDGGDVVTAGASEIASYRASNSLRIASCELPGRIDYTPRDEAEVLADVHLPVQR